MPTIARHSRFVKRRRPILPALGIVVIAAALVACLGMALGTPVHASTPQAASTHVAKQPGYTPRPKAPITVAAVGDSISAWNGTSPIAHPWTTDLTSGPVIVDQTDGFAWGGYTLAGMAAKVTPIHSDVLVVEGGTNDCGTIAGVITPMPQMIASLEQIVNESGATKVLLVAAAPLSAHVPEVTAWNIEQQSLAAENGWSYIDPYVGIRDAQGGYIASLTLDNIHPNDTGAAMMATSIAAAVESM